MSENRSVLCGANAYEQKYYFNKEQYGNLPQSVQDELHIICVLFTEEVGGISPSYLRKTAAYPWIPGLLKRTAFTMTYPQACSSDRYALRRGSSLRS